MEADKMRDDKLRALLMRHYGQPTLLYKNENWLVYQSTPATYTKRKGFIGRGYYIVALPLKGDYGYIAKANGLNANEEAKKEVKKAVWKAIK